MIEDITEEYRVEVKALLSEVVTAERDPLLTELVRQEKYEEAAVLRDKIKKLEEEA